MLHLKNPDYEIQILCKLYVIYLFCNLIDTKWQNLRIWYSRQLAKKSTVWDPRANDIILFEIKKTDMVHVNWN